MITRELLGHAHGVLAAMKDSDPGARVLRELVVAIEAQAQGPWVAVPVDSAPRLAYVTTERVMQWAMRQGPELGQLRENCTPLELRILLALVDHVQAQLREALAGYV